MKTFAMYSLGCKVNSYESNAIARLFEIDEYMQVDFKEKADVYIINTCTVTNTGDAKSRKIIRQAAKRNKDAIVVAFGCYAQVSPDEVIEIEGVDIVLGTQYRDKIVELVKNHDKSQKLKKVDDIFKSEKFEDFELQTHTTNKRAYLKIQEGCNNFCTYCIIPYARGKMRSRDKESIINEAISLCADGYNEIVLTGIHTGGYGYDLNNYNFDDLLEEILTRVPQLQRLRISSIEISQITTKTLDIIKNNPRIARHLHIPIQAGTDTILALMQRKYNIQQYLEKLTEIRDKVEDIALTTDLIVGFPNETDELFQDTLDLVEKCNFFEVHVFPYSARKGTPAASMENQVDERVKKQRVEQIINLQHKQSRKYINNHIGSILEVIVEGYDSKEELYYGHSSNYIKVFFAISNEINPGDIVNVEITENRFIPVGKVV
ncbi:tRNA (N(6)-L-threonylcarbamoyladenosine(37)-C(2))-methylthiotransferase MtaB [Mycoplasma sp. P36-A1]|uniref:tRNA (N(6)-L-threonylcarbamoyladenosine(37)-C(2))- methylthiotransferase MtaB n=1 Tax=Mycoplasma sp. P36-A1 TaxID=3252900 RepID=UPI003C30A2B1